MDNSVLFYYIVNDDDIGLWRELPIRANEIAQTLPIFVNTLRNNQGRTLLMVAVQYRREFIVEYLLTDIGADPRVEDNRGLTALWYANTIIGSGRIRHLLRVALNGNNGNEDITPVEECIINHDLQGLKDIFAAMSTIFKRYTKEIKSAFHLVCEYDRLDMLKFLWSIVEEVEYEQEIRPQAFNQWPWQQHRQTLIVNDNYSTTIIVPSEQLSSIRSAVLEALDIEDLTPIYYVRSAPLVSFLMEKGANIEHAAVRKYASTPVFSIVENNVSDAFQFIVEAGANINHVGRDGTSLLYTACFSASLENIIKPLLRMGVDMHAKNAFLNTAVHKVCFLDYKEKNLFQYLGRLTDPDPINLQKETPLIVAARYGQLPCCQLLIQAGAKNLQQIEKQGRNATMSAAENGHLEVVHYLISVGIPLTDPNRALREMVINKRKNIAPINIRKAAASFYIKEGAQLDQLSANERNCFDNLMRERN